MDTGSADILSACGLEARVPIKPWLELSFQDHGRKQKAALRPLFALGAKIPLIRVLNPLVGTGWQHQNLMV